jgi:dehydrogenase/reductase SDR family protein 12
VARYTTTVASPLAPEEAFDSLADFSTVASWDPGVKSAVRIDDGSLGVGSAFDVDVALAGRSVTFRYEITEFTRPDQVVLLAERSPFTSLDTITVEATDAGCLVTYDAELTLGGALRVADALLALGFNRVGDRAAAGLRSYLSGAAAPDRPSGADH